MRLLKAREQTLWVASNQQTKQIRHSSHNSLRRYATPRNRLANTSSAPFNIPTRVAVITTLAIGPDGKQRVISAALNGQRMQQVQEILNTAQQERIEEEPCVGFHCLVEPKAIETTAIETTAIETTAIETTAIETTAIETTDAESHEGEPDAGSTPTK